MCACWIEMLSALESKVDKVCLKNKNKRKTDKNLDKTVILNILNLVDMS